MPRVRPLTGMESRNTLAHRLGPRVDRIRQIATQLGIRSNRVFIVWARYSGVESGEGQESIISRIELLPTPKVVDLTSLNYSPVSTGVLPEGSIRIERISVQYKEDQLTGTDRPDGSHFFYEVVEDGRGDDPPQRRRFRLASTPTRKAGGVHWVVMLSRDVRDTNRDGQSSYQNSDD